MSQLYFEKQFLRRCGLHAVNNFLQKEEFKRDDFERISFELKQQTQQNHCTYFIGNYDLNVIEKALIQKNFEVQWMKLPQTNRIEYLKIIAEDQSVQGFIFNIIKPKSWMEKLCQWEPRHWVSVRKFEEKFYCYDSNQSLLVKETSDFVTYLKEIVENKENYVLIIKQKAQIQQQQQQQQQNQQQDEQFEFIQKIDNNKQKQENS